MTLYVVNHTDAGSGVLENAVLIAGEREAMLVDAHVIRPAAVELAALVKRGGWRLKHVFVSHPHPDHFGGLEVLRKEFPHAAVLAAPEVAAAIAAAGEFMLGMVRQVYGKLACDELVVPESCGDESLRIDGEEVRLLHYRGGEAAHQTAFHLPRQGTLVAADLVYNRVHPLLAERQPGLWLRHLEEVPRGRSVRRVFGGHGESPVDVTIFEEMAGYIRFFLAAVESASTAGEAIAAIARRYPSYRSADYLLPRSVGAYFPQGSGEGAPGR